MAAVLYFSNVKMGNVREAFAKRDWDAQNVHYCVSIDFVAISVHILARISRRVSRGRFLKHAEVVI